MAQLFRLETGLVQARNVVYPGTKVPGSNTCDMQSSFLRQV
ncbi:MAG TPA: hypothetical protein VGD98_24595 [Ktedonobacteraceae bacterium]